MAGEPVVILCAGLTPAWQQIVLFDSFRYGEVNRAQQVLWCASGKVFNAGIAAHHLGAPTRILATVGGLALPQIEADLGAMGVPYRWVRTRAATRVCTTILEQSTGTMTELVENGQSLEPDELDAYRRAYAEEAARAEFVVLIGSLPLGTPDGLYRELLEQTRCPAILDFRGAGLLSVLDLKPFVVKPNREELASTIGRPLAGDEDLVAAMRSLNERGAQWVVVTQGAAAVWATSIRETYRLHPPLIRNAVNPVASGDALAATLAWAVRAGRSFPDALRLGVAAAAQNVRHLLPCRLNPHTLQTESAQVRLDRLE